MSAIYHYASVSKALQKLRELGFTYDFNLNGGDLKLHPEDYSIQHIYRYEGDSNPDDASSVYGIASKFGLKGVFVIGNAANSSTETSKIIQDLPIKSCTEGSL